IGSYDRNIGKARISMEINHFIINVLDQDAIINNSLLINIISAYRSAGQTAVYIKLKDGIYYFNYMDGILLPMEI
ncbi:hypothetical protein, partial [Aeromonas jandaei]